MMVPKILDTQRLHWMATREGNKCLFLVIKTSRRVSTMRRSHPRHHPWMVVVGLMR